jgi:hypothetical protein
MTEVRANLEDCVYRRRHQPNMVVIEGALPNKNHDEKANSFRGSKYRGPSKNRKKWQVMKMINKQTVRIGTVATEKDAARIYDFMAILKEG